MLLVEDICSRTVSEAELSHLLDYLLDLACDEKYWRCLKRCVVDICIRILIVLNFILKHIGRGGKMIMSDRKNFLTEDRS